MVSWKNDIFWMSEFIISPIGTVPPWIGWNASKIASTKFQQKVWYLQQINASPTQHAVVEETMNPTLKLADEAKKETVAVTYDLAIAKIAMQIQKQESPKYDRLFVTLGPFHMELAFFKAIGKVIAESGGPYVLQEAEAIASGSLKTFLAGRNYKRCKTLHEVLAVSLETLHFDKCC